MASLPAEKDSSRTILLRTAAQLMIDRGTIDVSLNEIAQKSQLNAALVKYYFGHKNGLMLALIEHVLGPSLEQLKGLLEMDMPIVDKLKLHIKGVINVYFRYPFINRLIHSMLYDKETAIIVSERISKPLADTQRNLLQIGIDNGLFKPIDPTMFYFIIMGACDHLFFGQVILKNAFGIARIDETLRSAYSDALLDMVLHGILTSKD